ncbi:hypothetical protein D3C73_1647620 [compost metagenome]
MQDGLASDGHIAGRAEQFQVMFGQGHIFLVRLVTVETLIVAAKRLTGTRMLSGGGHSQSVAAG